MKPFKITVVKAIAEILSTPARLELQAAARREVFLHLADQLQLAETASGYAPRYVVRGFATTTPADLNPSTYTPALYRVELQVAPLDGEGPTDDR